MYAERDMDKLSEVSEQRNDGEDALVAARTEELRKLHREEWRAIIEGKLPEEEYVRLRTASDLEKERLAKRVTTDSLVESVSNHGHFLQLLEDEVVATQFMQEPSSFLVTMDLDRFKETNDALGHPGADKLLQRTGEAIAGSLRPGDDPGRTGGDEFSAIIRRTNRESVIIVIQRLRKAVTEVSEEFRQEGFSQGVSIGFCLIPKGLSTKAVRDIADAALYTVKNSGRNQIAEGSLNPQTGSIETAIVPSESTLAHR